MLTDKTLDLLLDLVEGQREAIIAVDDRGIAGVARFARDDLDTARAPRLRSWWPTNGSVAASRAGSSRPLAQRARSAGIERFRAEIQADNTVARRFFLGSTPTARERQRNGDVVVLINVAELLRMLDYVCALRRTYGAPILVEVAWTQGGCVRGAGIEHRSH